MTAIAGWRRPWLAGIGKALRRMRDMKPAGLPRAHDRGGAPPALANSRTGLAGLPFWLLMATTIALALSSLAWAGPGRSFQVFDGTLYRDKPDLTPYGIETAHVIYGSAFFKRDAPRDNLPEKRRVQELARQSVGKGRIVVLDIERWRPDGADLLHRARSAAAVAKAVRHYAAVARWFHEAEPNLSFGFFGTLPIAGDRRILLPSDSRGFRGWESDNEGMRPIANSVDIIYPEAYTGNGDFARWARMTAVLIDAARQYGKKVYVFLWPVYAGHDPYFGGSRMPPAEWRRELDYVWSRADGVVIWGGWDFQAGRPARWNLDAPWWRATEGFLCAKHLVKVDTVCVSGAATDSHPAAPLVPKLSVSDGG